MCIVRRPSVTYGPHCCIISRFGLHSNTLHLHYFSMDILYMYVYIYCLKYNYIIIIIIIKTDLSKLRIL